MSRKVDMLASAITRRLATPKSSGKRRGKRRGKPTGPPSALAAAVASAVAGRLVVRSQGSPRVNVASVAATQLSGPARTKRGRLSHPAARGLRGGRKGSLAAAVASAVAARLAVRSKRGRPPLAAAVASAVARRMRAAR
jgi:hypothetical protein